MSFLRDKKDEIASFAAIVSTIAIIFGAWQFYLTREAVQSQTIGNSLAHGRSLYDGLLEKPELADELFGANPDDLGRIVFVRKTLSFFSEQYVYFEGRLIDRRTWAAVQRDMCATYQNEGFRTFAQRLLDSGSYPKGFIVMLKRCSIG